MQMNTFETMNRKLEQFLYLHGIPHIDQYKSIDGLNVWVYHDSAEVKRVVTEFRTIQTRIHQQKRSA